MNESDDERPSMRTLYVKKTRLEGADFSLIASAMAQRLQLFLSSLIFWYPILGKKEEEAVVQIQTYDNERTLRKSWATVFNF